MVKKGYKYISWDVGEENAEIYIGAIEKNGTVHFNELSNCRGHEDKVDMPGIYFCESLDDLYVWLKEFFEYANPSMIELIEVEALESVQRREYENGRVAYVTPLIRGRVLHDRELPEQMLKLIRDYFDKM